MAIKYRQELGRPLTYAEGDENFRTLEESIEKTLAEYPTLTAAMADDIPDGVVFIVNDGDDAGYWRRDSSLPEGAEFLRDFPEDISDRITQDTGDSETEVMSQAAVTSELDRINNMTFGKERALRTGNVSVPSVGDTITYDFTDLPGFHTVFDVSKGDEVMLSGRGYNGPSLYGVIDANDRVLDRYDFTTAVQDLVIKIEQDGKFVFNTRPDVEFYVKKSGDFFEDTAKEIRSIATTDYGFVVGGIHVGSGVPSTTPTFIRTAPVYFETKNKIGEIIKFNYTYIPGTTDRYAYCYLGDVPVKPADELNEFIFNRGHFQFEYDGTFDNVMFNLYKGGEVFTEEEANNYKVYGVPTPLSSNQSGGFEKMKLQTVGDRYRLHANNIIIPDVGQEVTYELVPTAAFHTVIDVKKGEEYMLTGRGLNNPRLYGIVDENDVVIERADSGQISYDLPIKIEQDGKLIFNTYDNINGDPLDAYIAKIGGFFEDSRNRAFSRNASEGYFSSFRLSGAFSRNVVIPDSFELDIPENRVNDIYTGYDSLVTNHPDYVTKSTLGNDSTGLPINRYDFSPVQMELTAGDRKRMKMIIISGVHGFEPAATRTVFNLMNNVCNNWKDDSHLEYLRFNIDFIVIPMVNPYGALEDIRKNANGVDLNRNFPEGWRPSNDPEESTYGGPEPLSELESQYIHQVLEENRDAIAVIDCHNLKTAGGGGSERMLWCLPGTKLSTKICDELGYRMLSTWAKEYDFVKPNNDIIRTSDTSRSTVTYQATSMGFPVTCTFEMVTGLGLDPNGETYDSNNMTTAYEALVNFVSHIAQTIANSNTE